jgi:hypothetical protein
MTFEQRKSLLLAGWTATVVTLGIILTVDKPSMWVAVGCLAVVPPAAANWLWNAPDPTLAELIARHRR